MKDNILHSIRQNKPAVVAPLPDIPAFVSAGDYLDAFRRAVEAGNGQTVLAEPGQPLAQIVRDLFPDARRIASAVAALPGNVALETMTAPHDLEHTDVAVIPAALGVAENGALWVTERDCIQRILPFIAQHLVVVLPATAIVRDMHEAYCRIRIDDTGFGLFIAGPSKTADIEQALVIGAQGARSLAVVIE